MARTLRLHPDARPARRGAGEVQFGLFPDCGLVVAGLTDAECDLLLTLRRTVTDRELLSRAAEHGVPAARVHRVLDLLREHDLLVTGPAAPRRAAPPPVAVHGEGLLAERLRTLLDASGIPRAGPGTEGVPGLVVNVSRGAPRLDDVARLVATPTLPVVTRATGVVVGPVVGTPAGPCLSCVELHRRDRDRARPRVLAQVAAPAGTPVHRTDDGVDPALLAAAAGLTVLVAGSVVRGLSPPPGRSWELTGPWPAVLTRRWTRHPACRCGGAAAVAPAVT